jgi:hypothetical protein
MMNADKQTCLTHIGPGINHPVLPFQRESQKITREQKRSAGDWDIRGQHHPAGEEGHKRLPEGSSVTTGEKSL